MKIIGIVGMPGSGKSEAAEVAREMGIPVLVMGDVIRREADRLGLEPSDENLGRIGTQLRVTEGAAAVARRCLQRLAREFDVSDDRHIEETADSSEDLIVVEGIRSKDEIDYFRENCQDFHLVEIRVPSKLRLKRISERGRSDDPHQKALSAKLEERDRREIGWGMNDAIEGADLRIDNEGDLEVFRALIASTLNEMKDL